MVNRQHPRRNPQPLQGSVPGPILHLPHDDLKIPPWDIRWRSDERSRFSIFAAEFVAELVNAVEGEIDGE